MLMAYAAENLLKGIAVAKGRVRFSEQQLPEPLVGHDLNRLHKLASPEASVELGILETLTFMSLWQARYPSPKSVSEYWPVRDDGTPKAAGYAWPQSYEAVLAYYGALESELLNLIAAGR